VRAICERVASLCFSVMVWRSWDQGSQTSIDKLADLLPWCKLRRNTAPASHPDAAGCRNTMSLSREWPA
jgi:hypothetical protein